MIEYTASSPGTVLPELESSVLDDLPPVLPELSNQDLDLICINEPVVIDIIEVIFPHDDEPEDLWLHRVFSPLGECECSVCKNV